MIINITMVKTTVSITSRTRRCFFSNGCSAFKTFIGLRQGDPVPSGQGGIAAAPFCLIAIAIAAMNPCTEAMADPLYGPFGSGDIERSRTTHCDPPEIAPLLFPCQYHGPDDIAGLEAPHLLCAFGTGARKAKAIHAAHLSRAVAGGGDQQWGDLGDPESCWCARAHTGRIQPMCLQEPTAHTVAFGYASAAAFHRQACRLEPLEQRPAGRIDSRRIFQRCLRLRTNLLEPLGLLCQEHGNILRPLGLIARRTGQTEISHPVGSAIGFGLNMFN